MALLLDDGPQPTSIPAASVDDYGRTPSFTGQNIPREWEILRTEWRHPPGQGRWCLLGTRRSASFLALVVW